MGSVMKLKRVEYKPMDEVEWKEYYKIDSPQVKYFSELYKISIEKAYQGLNEYACYVYENWKD